MVEAPWSPVVADGAMCGWGSLGLCGGVRLLTVDHLCLSWNWSKGESEQRPECQENIPEGLKVSPVSSGSRQARPLEQAVRVV